MKRNTAKSRNTDLMGVWDQIDGKEIERSSNFWKPEAIGDMLVGVYAGKHDGGKDAKGKPMGPVADIKTMEGIIVPVGLNASLESLLSPDLVGKHVAIQYFEDIERPGKPNAMRNFRVKVISPEEAAELASMID